MFRSWCRVVVNYRFENLQHFLGGGAGLGVFLPASLHQFPHLVDDGGMARSRWALLRNPNSLYSLENREFWKWLFASENLYDETTVNQMGQNLTRGNAPQPSALQRRKCLIPCCMNHLPRALARSI